MQKTTNLGLNMPEDNEWADKDVYDENMEVIDREISTNASNIAELYEHDTTLPMTAVSAGSTEEEINNFYDNYSAEMKGNTTYKTVVSHAVGHSLLGGGTWLLEGMKHTTQYEYQTLKKYGGYGLMEHYTRTKFNSVWTPWKHGTQPWQTIGSVTGANSVTIDSDLYTEFLVVQKTNGYTHRYIISANEITGDAFTCRDGSYLHSTANSGAFINVYPSSKQIHNSNFFINGTDYTSTATMTVYGKRG